MAAPGVPPRLAAARVLDAVVRRGRSLKAELARSLPALEDPRDRALVEAICERLHEAGIDTVGIEDLYQRAVMLTGQPDAIRFTDRPVAVIRYRDGSVIDAVYQIAADTEG